jgi:DNA (cytosine-5)-methyltransferase 1
MTTASPTTIVDLFAGAGGWEEGLAQLGHHAIGIETDPLACQTAEAAGHRREQVDVARADPWQFGAVWGLIASPPCQAYSMAGKGLGRIDKTHVVACAHDLADGRDTRPEHLAKCRDSRSLLTVEPLRWALALRPAWVAMEQVPPVLELWELFGELLSGHGYSCAVGVLSAERYGVPQTRRRAFLIASHRGAVKLPEPTHRSYNPRHPDRVLDEERELLPWVSMATALGFAEDAITYTNCQTHGGRRPRGLTRPASCPARTLDTSAGAWTIERPGHCGERRHTRRTPQTGHQSPVSPDGLDVRQTGNRVRPTSAPAPTMLASGLSKGVPVWVRRRPATTVCTDGLVRRPGHKCNASDPPGKYPGRNRDAVRVTVQQAAVLQGFRVDYPWHGSRSRQFRQIGNAVCPPLAAKVLTQAMRSGR